jgi:hypothetical protein
MDNDMDAGARTGAEETFSVVEARACYRFADTVAVVALVHVAAVHLAGVPIAEKSVAYPFQANKNGHDQKMYLYS